MKLVQFRNNQKITTDDLNNVGGYSQQYIDAVVEDAIAKLRYFTGFQVTKSATAEITVAPGRLWAGADGVFEREAAQIINLLTGGGNYIPVTTKRIVAVVVTGQEVDTNLQERSFKINDQGGTEPQSVAMLKQRFANVAIVGGAESPDPQKPTLDAGVIPVAWVTLSTTGVVDGSIETATSFYLPSVESLATDLQALQVWKDLIGQIVQTILSELARIQAAIPPDLKSLLAMILARLEVVENAVRKPTSGTATKTLVDKFLTDVLSDTDAGGYSARIDNGLRFPIGTPSYSALALNNPLDPKVKKQGNILLPAFTNETTRLSIDSWDSQLSISQYTSQECVRKQKMLSRRCNKYTRNAADICGGQGGFFSMYSLGEDFKDAEIERDEYDRFRAQPSAQAAKGARRIQFKFKRGGGEAYDCDDDDDRQNNWRFDNKRCRQRVECDEPYWYYVTKDATVTGSQIAQTFLNATNGWLTSVDIPFSAVAEAGNVNVFIAETTGGRPNMDDVVGRGVINVASLSSSGRVKCTLEEPVYMQGGKTYACILVSTGNHFVRVRTGDKYKSGAAFYLNDDGSDWLPVQNSGDVCLAFNYAEFSQTRIEVNLEPLTKVGGISNVKITAAQWEPQGTFLTFEAQRGGLWYQLSEGEYDALSGNPTLVPLRMVFNGTRDLMPGIDMNQTEVEIGVIATSLQHQSEALTTPASTSMQVHLDVTGYDAAAHTITPSLLIPGAEAADSVTITVDPEDSTRAKVVGVFTPTSITSVVVKVVGSTSDPEKLFTINSRTLYVL